MCFATKPPMKSGIYDSGYGKAQLRNLKNGRYFFAQKQTGPQGFYKVWVSDAPIEAE